MAALPPQHPRKHLAALLLQHGGAPELLAFAGRRRTRLPAPAVLVMVAVVSLANRGSVQAALDALCEPLAAVLIVRVEVEDGHGRREVVLLGVSGAVYRAGVQVRGGAAGRETCSHRRGRRWWVAC